MELPVLALTSILAFSWLEVTEKLSANSLLVDKKDCNLVAIVCNKDVVGT